MLALAITYGCNNKQNPRAVKTSLTSTVVAQVGIAPSFAYAQSASCPCKGATLSTIASKAVPAVVNVASSRVIVQQLHSPYSPFFNDPFFRQFFGPMRPKTQKELQQSLGSGVIVSQDGTIVTNNHVIAKAQKIVVTLPNKQEVPAKVIGADPKSDLAVLRLEKKVKDLPTMKFGDSDQLQLGDVVLAIGDPFGIGRTVTMGIVSAKGRANMGITAYEDFIQTDAAINPGNSGGALVDMDGNLIGINTAILSKSGGFMGIGFAIPSNMAKPIMESLIKHGKVTRGYLGVTIQELTPQLAQAMDLNPNTQGVLVADVMPDSPAAKGGIKRSDVILSINGEKVATPLQLRNLVATAGANTKVELEILRKGRGETVTITLAEMESPKAPPQFKEKAGTLSGMTLLDLNPSVREKFNIPGQIKNGVLVDDVDPDSLAAQSGIRPGDVILEINQSAVKSVSQFTRLYHGSQKHTLLLIYRDGTTMYFYLSK